MSRLHLLASPILMILCCQSVIGQVIEGFNAAIGSHISANITCGSPAEQYFNTRQGYVTPRDRVVSTCNASDPANAHPALNMIDGQFATFWQASNDVENAYINIDLNEAVFGKGITITFGDYRRPGQIAIFKSADFGKTYSPWHYQVTALSECTSVFNIPTNLIYQLPDRVNRTVCTEYKTYPLEYDEVITINLNGDQRGDDSANFDSPEFREWLNVTNIHIRFTGLFRKFDYIDTRWHHYVVREINVISTCNCNGHGNGNICPVNTTTGQRECQCADNTCGPKCDRCCPGFNQYLWKPSSGPLWQPDSSTACKKCNCFDHSSTCVYNATVATLLQSLDINGNYSGGGVCIDCQHNTEGINCQDCRKFYYRPEGRARNLTDSCIACGCFANGTTNQLGYDFLECIRDEVSAQKFTGKKSGDCFCKLHVTGKTCRECKNGYYRLEGGNPQGCLPCDCHLPGTINRNSTCNKDFFGQCSCKQNVELRNCSQCKEGYYGLSDLDVTGCQSCSCDVGASSSFACNRNSGQCPCRPFLTGRTCQSVSTGYYYSTMHFISGSRSLFASASFSLRTTIFVPKKTIYKIYAAYSMATSINQVLTLKLQKGVIVLSPELLPTANVTRCDTECFAVFHVRGNSEFTLDSGMWSAAVSSSSEELALQIERIFLIPQLFYTASILNAVNRDWFLANCNVTSNDMRIGTSNEQRCLSNVYSLTTFFNNGALPCNCSSVGSINSTCQTYGGQCHCKQGVGTRDCSSCLPGFYDFSATGCKPCDCKGPNKICDTVTGICQCPNNTVGRVCDPCACSNNSDECYRNGDCINCANNSTSTRCELCKTGFYGDALTQTCKPCDCHIYGSLNQTCHSKSGQCFCKSGVVGLKCDRCLPNYYGLMSTGCFPCNCNLIGSTTPQCFSSGQCNCTVNAGGLKCDICNAGYYGLPSMSCQPCTCDPVGTISGTVCSRDVTGQCQCKPGVTGRTCNGCMKQYVSFSSSGCQQCSLCTRQMQDLVSQQKLQLGIIQSRINETKQLSLLQAEVVRLQNIAKNLQVNGALYSERISKGQSDYQLLINSYLSPLRSRHSNLLSTVSRISQNASSMVPVANANVARMKSVETSAIDAANLTQTAAQTATSVFLTLASRTSSMDALISRAFSDVKKVSLTTHQAMLSNINADLALSNTISSTVTSTSQSVTVQQETSSTLSSSIQNASSTFSQWNFIWRQQLPQFLMDIQFLYTKGSDLQAILNSTKTLLQLQEQYMRDTQVTQASVQSTIQESTSIYQQSLSASEESKLHTTAVSGTIEVVIYQFIVSTLTVKILNGKNLVARDFPSKLSDPYFHISLRPDWNNNGVKMSPVINGTLSPSWPSGDSYMFSLSSSQLQQTTLLIDVYDKDISDADEFMGEVTINLASIPGILTGTVSQTYQVKPKGYDSIWTSSFMAGPNSITDLQQILTTQISTVQTLMTQAEAAVTRAQTAANTLQTHSASLTSSFSSAKTHASVAVNAVNKYREVYKLINGSLEATNAANKTSNEILTLVQNVSLSNLQSRADAALLESQVFLSETKARNTAYPSLQFYLRSETIGSSGISNPPRSIIEIDGKDYSKNLDGFNIATIDILSGVVESSVNFRVDSDQSAALPFIQYLQRIPGKKIVAMVKQSQGEVSTIYQTLLFGELMSLGAIPPIIGEARGSYALLGYKRGVGEVISWIQQVGKNSGQGVSEIRKAIPLQSTLADLIGLANTTFQSAWPTWQEVNRRFTLLKAVNENFLLTESTATLVQSSLQTANILLRQAGQSASRILTEAMQHNRTIYDTTLKYNQIVYSAGNASAMIANASSSVSQAEIKLPSQLNNVNAAKTLYTQMNATEISLESRVLSIEAKLKTMRTFAQNIPFSIQFAAADATVYQLLGYSQSVTNAFYNDVGFDMKANSSRGVIFYILSEPGKMRYSIGLYLQDGYLHLIYQLGYGQTVIRNNMKINTNQWYNIYAARQGRSATLTVRDSNGLIITAQGQSIYSQDTSTMGFSSTSRVYLGGFAPGFMTSLVILYGQYSGVIDNLLINNMKYNLWGYASFSGSPKYSTTRYGFRAAITGTWVSLFGNGFIRHGVGSFKIDAAYSQAEFEFRTLRSDAVILGVTNSSGSFIYALYIIGGKLLFQFSSGLGQNAALMTQRNTYADGRWYKVSMTRTSINATFSVSMVGSTNPIHTETINVFAQTALPAGFQIMFGAPPTTNSAGLPTTVAFAGDIRYLRLSAFGTRQMLSRSFNSIDRLAESGVSYYGMIDTQVVSGTRFYGFMWWKNFGSYASLIPGDISLITSISLVFKTNQLTGLIMYSTENNHYLRTQRTQVYFYMALFGGNLVLILHDSNFATMAPYVSQNLTLCDGKWHTVSLTYLSSSLNYQLIVDSIVIYTGWFGNFKREIAASNPFYFGGVPTSLNIPFSVPTKTSLTMDVQSFLINNRLQNFHQSTSFGVSYAGVRPSAFAPQPSGPPPSCGAGFPSFVYSTDANQIQFGQLPWTSNQSYIGYNLTEYQKGFWKTSFVLTLDFKATSKDGVMLYVADSETHPRKYVSLELVNGKLQFSFSLGDASLKVTTQGDYADGKWHLIHMLRLSTFGAILLPASQEYQRGVVSSSSPDILVNTPLYIGGLPYLLNVTHFNNRRIAFTGCLRRFEVASSFQYYLLNLAAPDLRGSSAGASSCYMNVEPGTYFNGSGWIHYDTNYQLNAFANISLSFKTNKRSGVLFYMFTNDTLNGADNFTTRAKFIVAEINQGRIDVHYKPVLNEKFETISWTDANSNSSYLICDQQWHNLEINILETLISISVDSQTTVLPLRRSDSFSGNLYFGGVPNGVLKPGSSARHFDGCLKSIVFATRLSLSAARNGENVRLGCPMSNST